MTQLRVTDLPSRFFDGVVPAALGTVSAEGMPNATWISQVHLVDERHIALSCQFFRKSRENLAADPRAQLLITDAETFRQYRLDVRFARQENSGPIFEQLDARIRAIASLTGMQHAFALRSADIFEVMMITAVDVRTEYVEASSKPRRDALRALARITEGISACRGLEAIVQTGLELITQHLGLDVISLYLADDNDQSLDALASRGYPASGVGARIGYGIGLIGATARQRMPIRVADMARELRYGRVVREQVERASGELEREVPLPGLPGVASLIAVPLIIDGELFGVLSSESTKLLAYDEHDVQLLTVAGQLFAQAIARAISRQREEEPERDPAAGQTGHNSQRVSASGSDSLKVRYYEADDSVFLNGEYLIKGLPGRILWMLLTMRRDEGRDTFSNRELRLHPALKLPGYKDNLETRLLMLQRRLQDKSSTLRLLREQRGRLRVVCEQAVDLELTAAP